MNWASTHLGASLVDCSSQLVGCEAEHVLQNDLSRLWLSGEGAPQWLCISLQQVAQVQAQVERQAAHTYGAYGAYGDYDGINVNSGNVGLIIRTVGWHNWQAYSTNPRLVSMHVSSDGKKFKNWDNFEVPSQTRGIQLYSCAPVDVSLYPFIALEVGLTFGASQTYMNRVYLYSDEVVASRGSSCASLSPGSQVPRTYSVGSLGSYGSVSSGDYREYGIFGEKELSFAETGVEVELVAATETGGAGVGVGGAEIRGVGVGGAEVGANHDTDDLVRQLQSALGISEQTEEMEMGVEGEGHCIRCAYSCQEKEGWGWG
ncbi:hypothetical protein B484DRAFT_480161 [Ochromonadaceae sp. CCMP2298]|nr:hypothetical protein B484DRAFT_480161 [Ochromonadaceae sp. CCMP2298]